MTDDDRGRLLVDHEKQQNAIEQNKQQLRTTADNLQRFAQALRDNPDSVLFGNAPDGLGSIPPGMESLPAFDWKSLDVLRDVAKTIQGLRASRRRLASIEDQLNLR